MRRILVVSLLAAAACGASYAQAVAGYGAVTGIVRDIYGDGIPEVTVVLSNPTMGIVRTMITSDDGLFTAAALYPSGSYKIKVTKRGYTEWHLDSFDVSVGETVNLRIPLAKGGEPVTQAQALGALAPVQDTKTGLAALVTADQIASLPVNARLLDRLALLAPAVSQDPSNGALIFRGEPFTNSHLVDGIDTTNTYYADRPQHPMLSLDAMEEMQVISAAAPAEFGHAAGGILNAVTRSANNTLHASAYDYYNTHSLNAPDRFGSGFKPSGNRQQAGANFGAPIASDHFYGFGNFEYINDKSEGLNRIVNPVFTDLAGTSVPAANCTVSANTTAAQCANAINFIKSQMNVVVPRSLRSNTGFVKFDFRPGESNNFTVEGGIGHQHAPNGTETAMVSPNGGLLGSNGTYTEAPIFAKFGWTDVISGNAVNEMRGGWTRDKLDTATNFALAPSTGPVGIYLAGTPLGANPNYPTNFTETRITGIDTFSLTVGSNTIKFGADVSSNQDRMDQLVNRYGTYYYGSLTAFATDFSSNVKQLKNYSLFQQSFGTPVTNIQTMGIHGFVHDTWKANARLIVNFGVRYEKARVDQPTQPNSLVFQSQFIPTPNTNAAPRVGAAYMLDSRTVVRIGLGEFHEPFTGQLIRDLFVGGGVYQTAFNLIPADTGAPVFSRALASTSAVNANLTNITYTAERFRNPYTEQGTVAIERRVNSFVAVALSYLESRGNKLWTATDQNLAGAKTDITKTYSIQDANGNQTGTYNPTLFASNFGQHFQVDNGGSSRYRGATAQVRTALSHGLSMQVSYTWSHAYDDESAPRIIGGVVPATTFVGGYANDWGSSVFDQRNRVVMNWLWRPHVSNGKDPISRFVLNGWQVSGIVTAGSSMHTTPVVDVVGQQFSGFIMAFPNSLNGSGGWNRVPFQGINSLPIGPYYNVDARVSRDLPITDRLKGILMVEAYNALNRQNNTSVLTTAYTAVGGVLKPVPGVGTPNASYGYPFGTSARRVQVALRIEF
jgi:hypothetical protein